MGTPHGQGEGAAEDNHDDFDKVEACTTSTNTADDYAHRGHRLTTMPFYVYRMYVRRVPRSGTYSALPSTMFAFEARYALARSYAQQASLHRINVPAIDGFQCPTLEQDAEQNVLLKALLFTPWSCRGAQDCGCIQNFTHMLSSKGTQACGDPSQRTASASGAASQLAARASSDASQLTARASGSGHPRRKYTFQRAWRLRRSEIHVLASRADARRAAARKWLVLADTTAFAERKEPASEIAAGGITKVLVRHACCRQLQRAMSAEGMRVILAFLGLPCRWHDEQCALAEFSAYVSRDVMAHVDLAADARVKKPRGSRRMLLPKMRATSLRPLPSAEWSSWTWVAGTTIRLMSPTTTCRSPRSRASLFMT